VTAIIVVMLTLLGQQSYAYNLVTQQEEFTYELDDEFEDIDAALDQAFMQTDAELEARYEAVHNAIQAAFAKQTTKIEVSWPNDVVVPSTAVWVAYSSDYHERMIYDFERGLFTLELADSADTAQNLLRLAKAVTMINSSTPVSLASQDVFSKAIAQELVNIEAHNPPITSLALADSTTIMSSGASIKANYELLISVKPQISQIDIEGLLDSIAQLGQDKLSVKSARAVNADDTIKIALVPTKKKTNRVTDIEAVNKSGMVTLPLSSRLPLQLTKTSNGWSLDIPFVNNYQQQLIEKRMQTIQKMSKRFTVDVSTILAIIETESSFNPMATSHIPAFGLMQLVPKTAGIDAYRHVYGKRRLLSPDYLYDVDNNLELGTAYIDLLQRGYLDKITNPLNKLYSMIASYNTGVGNLSKTLTGRNGIGNAIKRINKMQPDEYYAFLQQNLPAIETKKYLRKVINRREKYLYLDDQ
jgi:membrane-bound lytic murein transglycosylase C